MAKSSRRSQTPSASKKQVKQTIKFLAVCRNPKITKEILKSSNESVIKGICNACVNAERGDVNFCPAHKRQLAKHRGEIHRLAERGTSIKAKRKLLVQKGGAAFLPILLSTVLSTVGPAILGALSGNNNVQ